jgi:hypothetical protein
MRTAHMRDRLLVLYARWKENVKMIEYSWRIEGRSWYSRSFPGRHPSNSAKKPLNLRKETLQDNLCLMISII